MNNVRVASGEQTLPAADRRRGAARRRKVELVGRPPHRLSGLIASEAASPPNFTQRPRGTPAYPEADCPWAGDSPPCPPP